MIKDVKIWIGENPIYSKKVQEYLFTQGFRWNGVCNDKGVNFIYKSTIVANNRGILFYGIYTKSAFDSLTYTEMKLIETVSYSLEEVKQREKICIGGKEYYKDELEVALKNIKPITENDQQYQDLDW